MIKSMTGFGRCLESTGGKTILVEIKSVNHRYYEFSSRVPRSCGFLDEKLKSFVQGKVSRGKIDVGVSIQYDGVSDEKIEVNTEVAKGYITALRSANAELGLEDDLTLSRIMRLPDFFDIKKVEEDEETVWNDVRTVAEKALEKFIAMREAEGEKMREDILSRLDYITVLVEKIEKKSPETT